MATNSNTHLLQIEAVDTLFFRDGKPFTMGENSTADGIFPPPMSAIYGALRTAYLADIVSDFSDTANDSHQLAISNIFFVVDSIRKDAQSAINRIDVDVLFPIPLDLVSGYNSRGQKETKLAMQQQNILSIISSSFIDSIAYDKQLVSECEYNWLNKDSFDEYLGGAFNKLSIVSDTITKANTEPKIGIALNKHTKTVRDSMLYRLNMTRLNSFVQDPKKGLSKTKKLSFVLQTNLPIPSTFIRLGGEGRLAKTTEIADGSDIAKALENIKAPAIIKYFKLYLLTPAVFNNKFADANGQSLEGLLPEFESFDPQTQECCWHGVRLKLLSAFIGRPTLVGGFDLAQSKPKAMQKAVPAGSVYYFELLEPLNSAAIELLIAKLHNKSICADENMQKQGYGISFVGNLNLA